MGSPNWEELEEKYIGPYIEENYKKNRAVFFTPQGKTEFHNMVVQKVMEDLRKKNIKIKNIHRQGMVKHYEKMYSPFQARLIKTGKVSVVHSKGKVKYYSKWTKPEEDYLLELYLRGASLAEISKKLGRNPAAITNKLRSIALKKIKGGR